MLRFATVAALAAALAAPAFAQTTPSTTDNRTTTTPPAVSTSNADAKTTAAPVPGKNSFTEGQAKSRLEDHGYSSVSGLHKDDNSVWRGKAMKDGKSVEVAVDFQGNITAH